MAKDERLEPWEVVCRQLRVAREDRGWTVRRLAARVAELGFDGPSEERISQLEAGARPGVSEDVRKRAENIRLREVIALSHALGVAPMNLLAPVDENGPAVRLGSLPLPSRAFRGWLWGIGVVGPDIEDWRAFYRGALVPKWLLRRQEAKWRLARDKGETKLPADVWLVSLEDTQRERLLLDALAGEEDST